MPNLVQRKGPTLAQAAWRAAKRAHSKRLDVIKFPAVIEALYRKKYAESLMECSKKDHVEEAVMFIIAVNLVEHKLSNDAACHDHDLDHFDWMPKFHQAAPLMNWIINTFVRQGSEWEINLPSGVRKNTLRPTSSVVQLYRRLEYCRTNIAKTLVPNVIGWQNQVHYIKQLWNLNSVLGGTSNNNVTSKIRLLIDKKIPPLSPTERWR